MKRIILSLLLMVVVLTGCQSTKSFNMLEYKKDGDTYTLSNPSNYPKYQVLTDDLNKVGGLNKDSRIVALTTSTANLVYEAGGNLVAAPTSKQLNSEIIEKQKSGEILNVGSALEPNLEVIKQANADVVFVADSMPHSQSYSSIEHLVSLPQTTYSDVYVSLYVLNEVMGLTSAKTVLNDLIIYDKAVKEQYKGSIKSAAVIQFTGGSMYPMDQKSFVGSMLEELRIKNVFAGMPSNLELSKEVLLKENPEYIFIYGHGMNDQVLSELLKDDVYASLDAVKNNKVILLPAISSSADLEAPKNLEIIVNGINK